MKDRGGVGLPELDDYVRGAPEVRNFIFPETSVEWEHTNQALQETLESTSEKVKWGDKSGEGCHYSEPKEDESLDVEAGEDAESEEVGEHGRGVVESHLLESEAEDKEETAPEEVVGDEVGDGEDGESEHYGVVLKMTMVDDEEAGLHEESRESNCLSVR